MKRISIMSMVLTVFGAAVAQARTECYVVGQDLSDSLKYNKLIQYVADVKIETGKGNFVYQTEHIFVSVSKTPEGKLSIATGNKVAVQSLIAVATGGVDSVSLVDGVNKIAIICSEK